MDRGADMTRQPGRGVPVELDHGGDGTILRQGSGRQAYVLFMEPRTRGVFMSRTERVDHGDAFVTAAERPEPYEPTP